MTTYPDFKNEPERLKIKSKDDEIKNLKYMTEKHDHKNILKSLKIDNDYYKRNYKSLNKKTRYKLRIMWFILLVFFLFL